jgi:hypothetical protein
MVTYEVFYPTCKSKDLTPLVVQTDPKTAARFLGG